MTATLDEKLDDVLGRSGYVLTDRDPAMARVVRAIMATMGKDTFRTIASLERMGYRPDKPDKAPTQYGEVVGAAFGYFRHGTRWFRVEDQMALRDRADLHQSYPAQSAAHDWMLLRIKGVIARLIVH